jgi:3-hydroxy-9,10-secoandrosta-1,3,5(10)-triene-9,17-dione monooxygenase reductase component
MEITSEQFRHVLGHLPTGVVIVAAYSPEVQVGMAVNSITSLSLDPPLILLCPARSSETWPAIRAAEEFCVSVIAHGDEAIARAFAMRGVDRFDGVPVIQRPSGPGIASAVAWLECRLRAEYDGGDHTVAIADVLATEVAEDAAPLVFFRGRYGTFTDARIPAPITVPGEAGGFQQRTNDAA